MKIDDIYKELQKYYEFKIAPDALKSTGHLECMDLISKIREGQDFCTFYLNLCFEQLAKSRQAFLAKERQVKTKVQEGLKAGKYSDVIRSVPERKAVIVSEAEQEVDIDAAQDAVIKLEHLKLALDNTLSNLRNAKEQLNMALKAAQLDWEIQRNGMYTGTRVDSETN